MDKHLEGKEYLAAGQFTIADIASYAWVHIASVAGKAQAAARRAVYSGPDMNCISWLHMTIVA